MSRTTRRAAPKLARPKQEDERGNPEPYRVAWEREYYDWLEAVEAQAEREAKRRAILAECFQELALELARGVLRMRDAGFTVDMAETALIIEAEYAAEQFLTLMPEACISGVKWTLLDACTALAASLDRNGAAN